MSSKILLRRGTATQWSSANPILGNGELGIETDTLKIKIGNGTSTWSQLASYANITPSELTSAINSIIDLSPSTLDTLNELAAAINDDPNFFTSVNTSLSDKASLTSANTFTNSPQTINIASTSAVGLVVKAVSGQTANVLEVKDGASNNTFIINSANRMHQGNRAMFGADISYPASLSLGASASLTGFIIRGAASQTANLQEWQNSDAVAVAQISATGTISTKPVGFAGNLNTAIISVTDRASNWTAGNFAFRSDSGGIPRFSFTAPNAASELLTLNGNSVGVLTSSPGSAFQVTANTAAVKGVIVKGFTSQSANLQEWQNSAGTVLAKLSAYGDFIIPDARVAIGASSVLANTFIFANTSYASYTPIVVRGAASQTANLQEWQNSDGGIIGWFNAYGSFEAANSLNGAKAELGNRGVSQASTLVLKIQGFASQTANLTEWQNSAGSVLLNVDSTGSLDIGAGSNNIWKIKNQTSTVMEWQPGQGFMFLPYGASNKPVTIKGAASQTANLTEWQNSAGTVLTRIGSDGAIYRGAMSIDSYGAIYTAETIAIGATMSQRFATGGLTIINRENASAVILGIKGVASQTADLTQWRNSSDAVIANVDSAGFVNGSAYRQIGGNSNGFGIGTISSVLTAFGGGGNAAVVPVVVRGASGQTANLQEWQNSSGTVLAYIEAGGHFGVGNLFSSFGGSSTKLGYVTVSGSLPAIIPLVVKGAASQTANLQEWQNSAGTALVKVAADGHLIVGSFNNSGWISINPDGAARIPIRITLATSQTADSIRIDNSLNTPLFRINNIGQIQAPQPASVGLVVKAATTLTATVTDAVGDGTTVTYTAANTFTAGQTVSITGVTPVAYNLTSVTIATATTTTFTVTNAATGTYVSGGTATVIQSSDLQQWQNSSGTVLGSVSGAGVVTFGSQSVINANMTVSGTVHSFLNGTSGNVQINVTSGTTLGQANMYIGVTSTTTASDRRFRLFVGGGNLSGQNGASINEGNLQFREVVNSTSVETNRLTILRGGEVLLGTAATNGTLGSTFGLTTLSASTKGAVIRGSASQTANLQEWQDSSGTVLAKINQVGSGIFGNATLNAIGNLNAFSSATTVVPLVVQGATSQTANLQEWQNSAGTVLVRVTNSGVIGTSVGVYSPIYQGNNGVGGAITFANATAITITPQSESVQSLIVKGAASQTANLQEWQDSAGAILSYITASGALRINSAFGGTQAAITAGSAATIGLIVRAAASQTANLQEWQNVSGTILASVTESGGIGIGTSTLGTNSKLTVSNGAIKISSGGTANADASLHISSSYGGFDRLTQMHPSVNNKPALNLMGYMGTGSVGGWFAWGVDSDGNWKINNGTSFSNPDFAVLSNATVGINTTTSLGQLGILNGSASRVGLVIRGSASQTADLQEWQNSAGTVLANITASGSLELNGKDIELMNIMGAF